MRSLMLSTRDVFGPEKCLLNFASMEYTCLFSNTGCSGNLSIYEPVSCFCSYSSQETHHILADVLLNILCIEYAHLWSKMRGSGNLSALAHIVYRMTFAAYGVAHVVCWMAAVVYRMALIENERFQEPLVHSQVLCSLLPFFTYNVCRALCLGQETHAIWVVQTIYEVHTSQEWDLPGTSQSVHEQVHKHKTSVPIHFLLPIPVHPNSQSLSIPTPIPVHPYSKSLQN